MYLFISIFFYLASTDIYNHISLLVQDTFSRRFWKALTENKSFKNIAMKTVPCCLPLCNANTAAGAESKCRSPGWSPSCSLEPCHRPAPRSPAPAPSGATPAPARHPRHPQHQPAPRPVPPGPYLARPRSAWARTALGLRPVRPL